jgi:cytochrome c oxidase subunit 2
VPSLHSVLAPAAQQSRDILQLWNVTVGVCTFVFIAVLVVLAIALRRRARPASSSEPAALSTPEDGTARRRVLGATIASVLVLIFLVIASAMTDSAISRASTRDALDIEVTGYRWWWSARYGDAPDTMFTTANEFHVPVGRPVMLRLRSQDVIHSFWVPALQGKKDLIPGRDAVLRFEADRPGRYRGQCAEFCGLEHAMMAFEVIADTPEDYAAWENRQRAPAVDDPAAAHGRDVFLTAPCAVCHTVRGTQAAATVGPDLTHLSSRRTIAAGTLPNESAALKRWIRDPQSVKPGAQMPRSELSDEDLDALVRWLGTLK